MSEMEKQPLMQHLIELGKRLMISFLVFFTATGISYFYAADIYAFLVEPLAQAFSTLITGIPPSPASRSTTCPRTPSWPVISPARALLT